MSQKFGATHLEETFREHQKQGRTTLIGYLTVGQRSVETTLACAQALLAAGCDVLELGVPFSDAAADGPVIAQASFEATTTGGSLRAALHVLRKLRETRSEPVVLFTYYNPLVAVSEVEAVRNLAAVGGDGLLVVDLPPDEGAELRAAASEAGLAVIPLVAPTSGEAREASLIQGARGFVYFVSVTGVTGSGSAPLAEAGRHAAQLKERYGLPVVVGFGIDSPEKARLAASSGASGVVVGTAIVRAIAQAAPGQEPEAVASLVRSLRAGLDG